MKILNFHTFKFLIPFLFISCVEKTYFDDNDLAWVNVYEENDTLIFQEVNSLILDTTIIVNKTIRHTGYNPIARDKNEHFADLTYKNKKYAKYPHLMNEGANMIEMYKNGSNTQAKPWLSYLGFSYNIEKCDLDYKEIHLSLSDNTFNQVYVFSVKKHSRHRKEQNTEPQSIFWDLGNGIIKYQTYEGKIWERVNW